MELLGIVYTIFLMSLFNLIISFITKKINILYCGIVGFSSKNNYDFDKIRLLALCNSYERGGDGTGIYTPQTNIIKDLGSAEKFFLSDSVKQIKPDNILIAHFRKASIGLKNIDNTHPFEYDNVVGCHNGTLTGYVQLATSYNIDHASYNIDSQVLINCISKDLNKQGQGAYLDIFKNYTGKAAVLYYDKNTNMMYVHRDADRPLNYGFIGEDMYISSLDYALQLIGCTDVQSFNANTVYMINNGKIISSIERQNLYINLATYSDFLTSFSAFKLKTVTMLPSGHNFTGIQQILTYLELAKNYNIKYTGGNVRYKEDIDNGIEGRALSTGKFYEHLGERMIHYDYKIHAKGRTTGYHVDIIDNNDLPKSIPYTQFDFSNFIPVEGRYMRAKTNLIVVESNKHLCNAKDYVKIIKHKFPNHEATIQAKGSNDTFTVPVNLLLPITEEEYEEAKQQFGEKKTEGEQGTFNFDAWLESEEGRKYSNRFNDETTNESSVKFNDDDPPEDPNSDAWIPKMIYDQLVEKVDKRITEIYNLDSLDENVKKKLDDLVEEVRECAENEYF